MFTAALIKQPDYATSTGARTEGKAGPPAQRPNTPVTAGAPAGGEPPNWASYSPDARLLTAAKGGRSGRIRVPANLPATSFPSLSSKFLFPNPKEGGESTLHSPTPFPPRTAPHPHPKLYGGVQSETPRFP